MSRKKLDNMKQTHGRNETYEATTLDQILGDTGMLKYGTMDVKEYTAELAQMNKAELQTHASKMGVIPIDNRELLTKGLVREFNRYGASYRRPVAIKRDEKPVSKEVLEILAGGR